MNLASGDATVMATTRGTSVGRRLGHIVRVDGQDMDLTPTEHRLDDRGRVPCRLSLRGGRIFISLKAKAAFGETPALAVGIGEGSSFG
jgi:hypothetical protein